jgi:hypothetical protein
MPSTFGGRGLFIFANLPQPGGLTIYLLGYLTDLLSLLFNNEAVKHKKHLKN